MQKKLSAFIFTVVLFAFSFISVNGSAGKNAPFLTANAATPTINSTDVKLYAIDSWVTSADPDFTIPENCAGSFQLKVTGASNVRYSVQSGSVSVSSDGLIKPTGTTWYWTGNVGTTIPTENADKITKTYKYGKSVIKVVADNTTFTVNVSVEDYAEIYANNIMDSYIAENITDDMTTYEKLSKICEFVAHNYDYSPYYSGCTSMIISGGGDCWASTYTIIEMAKKIGYTAWVRNGNRDVGSGSGHRNALVQDGYTYYECEAGYAYSKPRPYNVTKRNSLFSYSTTTNGINVYQYDGLDDDEITFLEVPETIDGKTVVAIGSKFISNLRKVETVILPSTVTSIGSYAFSGCTSLKNLTIPAAATKVSGSAFAQCTSLNEGFSVEDGNENYRVENGILYNGTILCAAPGVSGDIVVASGTTEIGDSAFYYNKQITSIKIPSTVKNIAYQGICDCDKLESVIFEDAGLEKVEQYSFAGNEKLTDLELPDSLKTIVKYAFSGCSSLTEITIPESVKTIGEGAFYLCYSLESVNIEGSGLESIGLGAFLSDSSMLEIRIPSSVTTIEDYAVGYSSQDKTIENFVIMADSGTAAAEYATENGLLLADYNHEHSYTSEITKEPTCTEEGTKLHTCTGCGTKRTEVISENGHDYTTTVYEPTYFSRGYTEYYCPNCESKLYDDYVDALPVPEPSNLTAAATGPRSISISWQPADGVDGYDIYYVVNGSTYRRSVDSAVTSYELGWLYPGLEYNIYVKSYMKNADSGKKAYSESSNEVEATTAIGNVTNLRVDRTNASQIKLSWDSVTSATGYIVYREVDGKFKRIDYADTNSYLDEELSAGTTYRYAVKAYYTYYDTTISSAKYPTVYGVTALAKVDGFKSTKATASSITLTWNKYSGATGYTLYRMVDSKWQVIATPTANTYTDTGLTAGTVYKYAVKANATISGQSVTSASFPTLEVGSALARVQNFKVAKTSYDAIKISWDALDGAEGYIVYRLTGSTWKNLGTTTNNYYLEKKLASGTKYTYAVRGYYTLNSASIRSESYPQVSGVTNLTAVTNIAVSSYNASAIKLSWSKVKGADGYYVYRMVNGKWKNLGATKNIYYLDKNLNAGTSYQYTVKAYKTVDGKKIYSYTYPTFKASTAPATVSFTVTAGSKKATLKWSAVTGATGYIVYYKTNKNGSWTRLTTTKNKTYTKSGLTTGKTYYFTVKAYRTYNGKTYNAAYTTKSVKIK